MSKAREIHGQAEVARELEQNFVKALQLSDEALVASGEENDIAVMVESLCGRVNTFKHLYQKNERSYNYLVLGLATAEVAIDIAERSGDPAMPALPYLYLAKISEEMGRFEEASEAYAKSVALMEKFKPVGHFRRSVVADMKNHWFRCKFWVDGDKIWIGKAEDALKELEEAEDASRYEKDVWLSGGHLRVARAWKDADQEEKARMHMEAARVIIVRNEDLKLRKGQWGKLAVEIG